MNGTVVPELDQIGARQTLMGGVVSVGEDTFNAFTASDLGLLLDEDQSQEVLVKGRSLSLKEGEVLFAEGDIAEDLGVVLEGRLSVRKADGKGVRHIIAELGPGSIFGESALQGLERIADVVAATDAKVFLVPMDDGQETWMPAVLRKSLLDLRDRISQTGETAARHLEERLIEQTRRAETGRFLTLYIAVLAVYSCLLAWLSDSVEDGVTAYLIMSAGALGFGLVLLLFIWSSEFPPSFFGIRLPRGRVLKDLGEALAVSAAFCVFLTALKLAIVRWVPAFEGDTVFSLGGVDDLFGRGQDRLVHVLMYTLTCPMQELMARGALQTMIYEVSLGSRYRVLYAILVSNVVFASAHAYVSPLFVISTIVPGVLWGALFHRQRSLLGVAISHILIGTYAFECLGLAKIVRVF